MANSNGRTCPKCGMNLGQKHLCPVCDQSEENTENRSNQAAEAGGDATSAGSQATGYVSRVIEFIGEHLDDWDNEFIDFFNGLDEKPGFNECYEACSKVSGVFKIKMPDSDRIPGSLAKQVMADLQNVFPELTNDSLFALAYGLLKKRMTPAPESEGSGNGPVSDPGKTSLERYRQLKYELLEYDVRDDFRKVIQKMNALLKEYPDIFKEDYRNFYTEIFLGQVNMFHLFPSLSKFYEPGSYNGNDRLFHENDGVHRAVAIPFGGFRHSDENRVFPLGNSVRCPLAFFAAIMNPQWNQFIRDMQKTDSYCAFGFIKPDRKMRTSEILYLNGPSIEQHIRISDDLYQFISDRDNRYRGKWHELVPKGKTVLILATGENIELRSPSDPDNIDFQEGDLMDGLEYRCTDYSYAYAKGEFAYMVKPE